jgi:hypothetical protein
LGAPGWNTTVLLPPPVEPGVDDALRCVVLDPDPEADLDPEAEASVGSLLFGFGAAVVPIEGAGPLPGVSTASAPTPWTASDVAKPVSDVPVSDVPSLAVSAEESALETPLPVEAVEAVEGPFVTTMSPGKSADHVCASTRPSAGRWRACWKAITAVFVFWPKRPSTSRCVCGTTRLSCFCSAATPLPVSPKCRSTGSGGVVWPAVARSLPEAAPASVGAAGPTTIAAVTVSAAPLRRGARRRVSSARRRRWRERASERCHSCSEARSRSVRIGPKGSASRADTGGPPVLSRAYGVS